MISVSAASDVDCAEWDQFVKSMPRAEVYHLYRWRHVFEGVFGHKCFYLCARNSSSEICGILPLAHLKSWLFGNFLISLPCFNYCGVLATDESVIAALVSCAKSKLDAVGASHIELRQDASVELDLPFRSEKVAMRMELPFAEEALWKQFSSKLRAQIRRPTKEGAVCEDGGIDLLDEFYQVFARNMRDLGTPVYPKEFFREICSSSPETTRIFVVRVHGVPCAAGITIGFRDRLEIPSASSLRDYNRISVNMLLYWNVLRFAINSGYRYFDFGRSSIDSGTFRFKQQWGAKPEPLRWYYILRKQGTVPRLSPDNPRYRLATRMWSHLPVKLANKLGPAIVRKLP